MPAACCVDEDSLLGHDHFGLEYMARDDGNRAVGRKLRSHETLLVNPGLAWIHFPVTEFFQLFSVGPVGEQACVHDEIPFCLHTPGKVEEEV